MGVTAAVTLGQYLQLANYCCGAGLEEGGRVFGFGRPRWGVWLQLAESVWPLSIVLKEPKFWDSK